MSNIAVSIAADFITAQGLACILIKPEGNGCTVAIGDIGARDEPGHRIWLHGKYADLTVEMFLSRCQQASRVRGGLVVAGSAGATAEKICDIARTCGHITIDDTIIDEQMAIVAERVWTALDRMQNSGTMETLNCQYRTARDQARAKGTPFPAKYDLWLVEQLKPSMQARAVVDASGAIDVVPKTLRKGGLKTQH
jgi:hypothetical protein